MKILNAITVPLHHRILIEASAGTGKTYTISLLYLRLLLGIRYAIEEKSLDANQEERVFSIPLTVEQILVVTFTNAATEELRERIRLNINELLIDCIRHRNDRQLTQHSRFLPILELLQRHDKLLFAESLLLLAQQQIDLASIYTINGFCSRILAQQALTAGRLFNETLLDDEDELISFAVKNFWRRYCYAFNPKIFAKVIEFYSTPSELQSALKSHLHGDLPKFSDEISSIKEKTQDSLIIFTQDKFDLLHTREEKISHIEKIYQFELNAITKIKTAWLAQQEQEDKKLDVYSLIENSGVKKNIYSKKNAPNWVRMIDEWAENELDNEPPEIIGRFRQTLLANETPESKAVPKCEVFSLIDDFFEISGAFKRAFFKFSLFNVRLMMEQEKESRAQMGFSDQIVRLDSAIQRAIQNKNTLLIDQIRQQFPVAMIDEFQDTDPQQYRIFSTIYPSEAKQCEHISHHKDTNQTEIASLVANHKPLLLLIGDPKQAIYAFRGADIFTYIAAKSKVDAIYTLDTNYRSAPHMIQAVNRLFQSKQNPFGYQEIPFQPVKYSAKNESYRFIFDNQPQAGIDFYLPNDDQEEQFNKERYNSVLSDNAAKQIASWLNASEQGSAYLKNDKVERKLTLDDIVVLVNDRYEAAVMKQALYQYGIHSTFISKGDSVFHTEIAADLLVLLQAIYQETNERLIRSALGVKLFNLTHQELMKIQQDERYWEHWLEKFKGYREMWSNVGILPMLRLVLAENQLAQRWQTRTQSERILMDFLHLSEILQEESARFETIIELLNWFNEQFTANYATQEAQQLRLESDKNVIRIITIHASKGLEFPIVFLPFLANFKKLNPTQFTSFYDQSKMHKVLELQGNLTAKTSAERELFTEQQRLLYVALTRAVYHCAVGLVPLFNNKRFVLPNSALGDLLLENALLSKTKINIDEETAEPRNISQHDGITPKEDAERLKQVDKIREKSESSSAFTQADLFDAVDYLSKLISDISTDESTKWFESKNIELTIYSEPSKIKAAHCVLPKEAENSHSCYAAASFTRQIRDSWRLSSYTQLTRHSSSQQIATLKTVPNYFNHETASDALQEALQRYEAEADLLVLLPNSQQTDSVVTQISVTEPFVFDLSTKSVFNFPKGTIAGTFLHSILEHSRLYLNEWQDNLGVFSFNEARLEEHKATVDKIVLTQLFQQLKRFSVNMPLIKDEQNQMLHLAEWTIVLYKWIKTITETNLQAFHSAANQESMPTIPTIRLVDIKESAKLHEMQFHLPIKKMLTAEVLNSLIKAEDRLSALAQPLSFEKFEGLLQGFIDLVFEHEGKFYLLDYKSNWLGDQPEDYDQTAIETAMIEHRYDVQYQLYTLALHRYLKQRLPNYDYDLHIGGVWYLFIRGMVSVGVITQDANNLNLPITTQSGQFYTKPSRLFIEQLDQLLG